MTAVDVGSNSFAALELEALTAERDGYAKALAEAKARIVELEAIAAFLQGVSAPEMVRSSEPGRGIEAAMRAAEQAIEAALIASRPPPVAEAEIEPSEPRKPKRRKAFVELAPREDPFIYDRVEWDAPFVRGPPVATALEEQPSELFLEMVRRIKLERRFRVLVRLTRMHRRRAATLSLPRRDTAEG